jgi:hypothetical protein
MSLYKEIEKLKYDKRLTDFQIRVGKISREDLNKHLQNLPDSADNVDSLRISDESGNGEADQLNGTHQ